MDYKTLFNGNPRLAAVVGSLTLGSFLHVMAQPLPADDYIVNGSASLVSQPTAASPGDPLEYQLTPDLTSQGGSVWYQNKIFLSEDFDLEFEVFLGHNNGGADGVAFVLQPNSVAAGSHGGGLGYHGISPSLAVEYDTWQNSDPAEDHISIQANGNVDTNNASLGYQTVANMEDGQWHSTRIIWDADAKDLTVYYEGAQILSLNNYDLINNIFGGSDEAYWGFTGATGGARNDQRFRVTNATFVPACGVPYVDVWDSTDPNNYIKKGTIRVISTAQTGKNHYNYQSFSGSPSNVNLGPRNSSIWVHENTGNGDLTFGFIFGKRNNSFANTAKIDFRIVDSDTNPYVSQSDDPGEAIETPAGSNAFRGTFRYNNSNTDGIAVSGISGNNWTIIIDSVDFGNILNWYAANGEDATFADDMVLQLGHEYRLTPACNDISDEPVIVTNQAPVAVAQDVTVSADANCLASVSAIDLDNGSSDPDGDPITLSVSPEGPYALGDTLVTLTVTDDSGATDEATATVTVVDNAPPVLVCPADIVMGNDSGQCGAVVDFAASATDNCDAAVSITYSHAPGSSFPVGTTIVNVIATDDAGNQDTCSFTVTVQDVEAPAIVQGAQDGAAECDGLGNLTDLNAWLGSNGGAIVSDNCSGPLTWSNDFSELSDGCGATGNVEVVFTVTDVAGNSSSTTATFTVTDTTVPELTWSVGGDVIDPTEGLLIQPNQVPVTLDILVTDTCGLADINVLEVKCFKINKNGDLIDKSDSCDIVIDGGKLTILDAGGVGTIIQISANGVDECNNISELETLEIHVENPSSSTANEGVGNGVDGNTPGHDNNGGNDDPGTSPGNPGAKGGKKNR